MAIQRETIEKSFFCHCTHKKHIWFEGDKYDILEFRSEILAPITTRLPVVLGSVRVRSLRSISKRSKGCTYVNRSICHNQRPTVPCPHRAQARGHRALHTG